MSKGSFNISDLETTTAQVANNSKRIADTVNKAEREDSGTVQAFFLHWYFNRVISASQRPPEPLKHELGEGKSLYILNADVILVKCIAKNDEVFRAIRDAETQEIVGYDMRCMVRYSKHKEGKSRNTEEFLKENYVAAWDDAVEMDPTKRANVRRLITAEGVPQKYIWERVDVHQIVHCTFMSFSRPEITTDITRLNVNGQFPVQRFGLMNLNRAEGTIQADVYFSRNGEWVFKVKDPEINFKTITPHALGGIADPTTLLSNMCKHDAFFCKPMQDVHEGRAQIPHTIKYHIIGREGSRRNSAIMYNDQLMRVIVDDNDLHNFCKKDDQTSIRRFWTVVDTYADPRAKYQLKFTAWEDTSKSFGIDSRVWCQVMAQNPGLPCFIFAEYQEQRTLQLEINNPAMLMGRQPQDPEGTYQFSVTALFPDYLGWFCDKDIQLTGEEVLDLFETVNMERPDIFAVSTLKSGRTQIQFHAPNELKVNPLHMNGIRSPVINLGSAPRPALECIDASMLFDNLDNKFYVLLGEDVADKEDFLAKAKAKSIAYQIFVVQNFDTQVEKKNVQ